MTTFKDLPLNTEFFDPYSAEDFIKISDARGKEVRNGEEDDFGPDDEVEPNQRA